MSCGIYRIRNTQNDKSYVGSSKEIEDRWHRHLCDLRRSTHHNIKLQRSFNKHGESSFAFEVIELTPESTLLEREQYYLDKNAGGYNIGKQAAGGDNLTDNPNREDIIQRMTASVRHRYAMRSDEEKKAYSDSMKGENNPNYGNKWDDALRKTVGQMVKDRMTLEVRQSISDRMKKTWKNEDNRAAMIAFCKTRTGKKNSFYGKSHSEETKQKIRDANTGRHVSDETRKTISKNSLAFYATDKGKHFKKALSERMSGSKHFLYGVGHTDESKTKMSTLAKERIQNRTKEDLLKLPCKLIKAEGSIYLGQKLAARYFNLSECAMKFRCTSTNPKWSAFEFVTLGELTKKEINEMIWR